MSPLLISILKTFPASSMVSCDPVAKDLYGVSNFAFDTSKFENLWSAYILSLPFSQQPSMMYFHNEAMDMAREKVESYLSSY